ncbi:branched-chain amino acid ABC transporter substrate-binding protein [Candidatus Planktophila versatilis]|uniref:Branched-chain amino acid transport system substrate-binding protein n=1 Tax=Candidatus Planktophila versatilis TaxID=1884905 RepID=A0ABM6ME51_9ACTN|nr:branched-chain amino acid ABC transporter substrate-binding protein [Candidatus Planktophila versatilis]ASY17164.1 branched-chain amino acid transport system substrate-binding protein [Candidatus Planktophila versatilis]
MNKKIVSGFAIAAAATLAFGAVATAPANAAPKTEVTLAFMGPLTGPDAQLGQDQYPGAEWAIALYNATNPKTKVKLIKADSQCDGTVAANIAPGVAANKAVIGVIGTSCSGEARNSFPAYKAAGLTMVAPSASAVSLTDPKAPDRGFPVFHRVVAHDGFQAPALVRYATKGVASPKIYLVDDQTTYGAGLIKYALPSAKKIAVAGTDSVPRGTADWTSVAAKVKAAGANVVIYGGYTTEAAKFFKALRDGGYTGILAAGDGVNTSDFPDLAGKAAEGVRLTAADVPFENLLTKDELASFTKITGVKVPGLYSTTAYNAARVFLTCIEQGKLTRPAIQLCVNSNTFKGAGGSSIKFNRYGDIIGGADVGGYLVKDGKIKYDGLA